MLKTSSQNNTAYWILTLLCSPYVANDDIIIRVLPLKFSRIPEDLATSHNRWENVTSTSMIMSLIHGISLWCSILGHCSRTYIKYTQGLEHNWLPHCITSQYPDNKMGLLYWQLIRLNQAPPVEQVCEWGTYSVELFIKLLQKQQRRQTYNLQRRGNNMPNLKKSWVKLLPAWDFRHDLLKEAYLWLAIIIQ